MKTYLIAFSALFLISCGSMPKHTDIRTDDQPTIYINESGIGAEVYIDGKFSGVVAKNQLIFSVTPGKHAIKIISPNGKMTQTEIFVQGNTRREINLNN